MILYRPVQTRSRYGSATEWLSLASLKQLVGSLCKRHAVTLSLGLQPLVGARFQVLFHSPARGSSHLSLTVLVGVLPTFPSRYWFAIGLRQSLALRDGPRGFGQDSTCPALLRCHSSMRLLARTGVSPSAPQLSRSFRFAFASPLNGPTTPTCP